MTPIEAHIIQEAKELGVTPDIFLKLKDEAWSVRPGPRYNEWDRPAPTTFRAKCDGNLWRVYFYHDGCPICFERVEGD